ncbi:MAG TPA: protein kinase [Polyangiaceae bacterium]
MTGLSAVSSVSPAAAASGRYEVLRVLGKGGMATVYAVVDSTSGAQLALKRLKAGASESMLALFEREYQVLAGLRHPCIVEVYDYGVDAEGPYYTMELVDGDALQRRAPVSWRKACAYLRDVASILGVLHARRLLHRDLSARNLIETKAGRLKLIDFGALASFGVASDIAGTPPFVAPEALRIGYLDQRSDLFSLGALGYWLVTGQHAFAARSLAELPLAWEREPALVSRLVRDLANSALEVPPAEFDELLTLLLRTEPSERIASTAELIDRLNVIADLAPEAVDDAVRGYIYSKAFVGREREQELARAAILQAHRGEGQVLLIDGGPGLGRSRLIQELTLLGRVNGAVTLSVEAAPSRRAYALADTLLSQLLRELPTETLARVTPHASDLAPLAAARRALGALVAAPRGPTFGEARARLQRRLLEVFAGVARAHFVAILIDDFDEMDEESQAFVTALAHRARELTLCLIVSLSAEATSETSATLTSLSSSAQRASLEPLTSDQTHDLLRSVFGEVPYLDRLSERLFRSCEGNPAHCLELAEHLVETGAARYQEGAWALPMELSPDSLPLSRRAGLLLRLARLPPAARALARAVSVPHGARWTRHQAALAAELSADQTQETLQVLIRERVLLSRDDGYVFSHEDVRLKLYDELEPARRRRIHARIGSALRLEAGKTDVTTMLSACVHLIRAGDFDGVYPLLRRALEQCVTSDPALIGVHPLAFEQVFCLLREGTQDQYALCGPLGMLAVAGYFTDRRYAFRYGELALEALQQVLQLGLFQRLSRFVGRRMALLLALGVATVRSWPHRARCLSIPHCVRLLLLAASTLAGTSAICMDPDRAERYAKVLEPFTSFGPDHAATLIHDFSALMCLQGRDRAARCVTEMRAMIERLADPRPIREMTELIRASYFAGTHLTMGVFLVRRDDQDGLAVADILEHFSPLYAMSADHLRANYYGAQGDVENARASRKRLEVHAVQLGSAWQVETWAPVDVMNIALRTHDASEMKRAAQELERLSAEVPSLREQALSARISYLVLRGKHTKAIALAEHLDQRPYGFNGWARMRGTLARAHNALGQHEEARRLCLEALAGADAEDRWYVVMNLGVEIELALAEAGLGRFDRARQQLHDLLRMHEPNESAVTIGSLHEALARVALLSDDDSAAREHLGQALTLYKPLGVPSLVAHARELERQMDTSPSGLFPKDTTGNSNTSALAAGLRASLGDGATPIGDARQCLEALVELRAADCALFIPAGAEPPVASRVDPSLEADLLEWARSLLCAQLREQTVLAEGAVEQTSVAEAVLAHTSEKVVGRLHFRPVPLWDAARNVPIGFLLLGSNGVAPRSPEPDALRVLAGYLRGRTLDSAQI